MKNSIKKLILVLSLVAVIGVSAFAQSAIMVTPECAGTPLEFEVKLDPKATGTASFAWSFKKTTNPAIYTYETGGMYPVSVTITFTGGSTPPEVVNTTAEVFKRPNAGFNFGTHAAACAGEPVMLSVNTYGNAVLWSTGETTDRISATTAGKYKAVVYNENLCTASVDNGSGGKLGEVEVMFYNHPEIKELVDVTYNRTEDKTGTGEQVIVDQMSNTYTGEISYSWNPSTSVRGGSTFDEFYLNPEKTMTYVITANQKHIVPTQGELICSAQRQVTVNVVVINGNESTPFNANNVFMPGTVYNNVWMMNGDNELSWYKNCKLIIYNIWGQEVFVADKIEGVKGYPDHIWDGVSSDGEELPADTYYYLVQCSDCNCEPNPQNNEWTGTVTIMRK